MSDSKTRTETDSLGTVEVPENALWGAQSQRSLEFFAIGNHTFPASFIHTLALIKKAASIANLHLGLLDRDKAELIASVCDEILDGLHDDQFPLSVWQTGSGTQTNMNVNEVIANRCNQLAGHELGGKFPVHPNDHVNLSQSSNDVFPTAMHVETVQQISNRLIPALAELLDTLNGKAEAFAEMIKIGRTHMMDATPVTLGQEFSGYAQQLAFALEQMCHSVGALTPLAIGGTAVGTGLNSHPDWAERVTEQISQLSGIEFTSAANKFSQLASHDALVQMHAQLNLLATVLFKIASDIRLMNSGPRCGLAEIQIPANEPGSSIMPGKVNPTQVEAMTMVCLRVMGNHSTISMANSQGQFELNVYKPLMIHAVLESISLLSDAMRSFTRYCLAGIQVNRQRLDSYVQHSLMLATALSPVIGYEKAAKVALFAQQENISLRQAAIKLGVMSGETFDAVIKPAQMLGPS